MQLSGWWMFLSFYQSVLAFPLAIVALVLLVRARSTRGRAACAGLLALVLLPHIQLHAGNYYFDYLCRTQAGEFIYRTVDNVEGILQMRPRDGSKDYFDRMRAGDIPEDPWGHTNFEAQEPWILFRKYEFFEKPLEGPIRPTYASRAQWHESMFTEPPQGAKYVRYFGYDGKDRRTLMREFVDAPRSEYGYVWYEEGNILTAWLNIYPGEIAVVHLPTADVLATKKGFLRVRPMQICPGKKDDELVFRFISKVLVPAKK